MQTEKNKNKVNDPHEQSKLGHGLSADGPISQYFAKEDVDPLTHAFGGKIAVHPGLGGNAVAEDEINTYAEKLSHETRNGKTVAYIHVPFCETHCLYCGFYNKPFSKDFSHHYTDSLLAEFELWKDRAIYNSSPIHAVYFGGGTPTSLTAEDLGRILKAVKEHLYLANDCEITIEGRLHNFGQDKIEACLEGGANRFSIGVQTFDTEIRKLMGRIADQETACKHLEVLQSYNQAAVIIDLIYGFPKQTMDKWLNDIKIAQSLNLDGADCYQLNVYGMTPLGKAINEGKIEPSADFPTQAKMFEASVMAMQGEFYRRLSMSHWARTTRERNLYNLYTKGVASGLAFGPGAGGALQDNFIINQPNVEKWIDLIKNKIKPIMGIQRYSKYQKMYRRIAENMEQGRLDFGAIHKEFVLDIYSFVAPIVEQWEKVGLVNYKDQKMVLTLAGQFWQVNLSQIILHRIKSCLEK